MPLGSMIEICEKKRGTQLHMDFISDDRVMLKYKLPLNEIIEDFYDQVGN